MQIEGGEAYLGLPKFVPGIALVQSAEVGRLPRRKILLMALLHSRCHCILKIRLSQEAMKIPDKELMVEGGLLFGFVLLK